jgi:hypothetical protein
LQLALLAGCAGEPRDIAGQGSTSGDTALATEPASAGESTSGPGSTSTTSEPVTSAATAAATATGATATITTSAGSASATTEDASTTSTETTDTGDGSGPSGATTRPLGACDLQPSLELAANRRCERIEVGCEGMPAAIVELHVYEPLTGPARGLVVLADGGDGSDHFVKVGGPGAFIRPAVQALIDSGLVVVDRRWESGWFGETGLGLRAPSCRAAVMLEWIEHHLHPGGGTCALGNSGGASELAYALAHWDGERWLDHAVLAGGPPMARLDLGCVPDAADPSWRATCEARWPTVMTECPGQGPHCALIDRAWAGGPVLLDAALATATDPTPCTGGTISPSRALAESVLAPAADVDYATSLEFIHASADCTEAPMLGFTYHDAVTSPTSLTLVPGAMHVIQATEAGADAVRAALLGCSGSRPASPSPPPGAACEANRDCDGACATATCVCELGTCVADSLDPGGCDDANDCVDGDPCTLDGCAPDATCRHNPLTNCAAGAACDGGIGCDDGDPCTADACVEGACQHRATPGC